MQPKVYIVNSSYAYERMFESAGWDVVYGPLGADLIQFTGGEDVSPCLYGEQRHPHTGDNLERDLYEAGYFAFAHRMGVPMAGICRGGQFLNVMSGGRMYQHVSAHATGKNHDLIDINTGRAITVSSTHHQQMIAGPKGTLVAVANLGGFKECLDVNTQVVRKTSDKQDVESVYYPHTEALCFQPHPEFFGPGHECFEYYFELIDRYHGLRA